MQVIKNHKITQYPWLIVDDSDPLPQGNVIVPLSRYLSEKTELLSRDGGSNALGVSIDSAVAVADIANELAYFSVVTLDCQQHNDGRLFSQAKLLREKYDFQGDILVIGALIKDQLRFLERCGVNVFWTNQGKGLKEALAEFSTITVEYQPAM
ncbi:MAG: DUF934 domain-containing protein [Gammaproteobacteria bacterium]|nr:DUF934 domain-containing protein [Gammaproteobacteria bacterium]